MKRMDMLMDVCMAVRVDIRIDMCAEAECMDMYIDMFIPEYLLECSIKLTFSQDTTSLSAGDQLVLAVEGGCKGML